MPLVRVEVRNEYGLGAPEMYREGDKQDPKEILQGVAVAGLVGVLRQLGDLADFAAEVFHGLQEEVAITSSRSHKLTSRAQRIEAALSPIEKALLAQRTHLHFAYTAGSCWHARLQCEKNLLVCSDVPQFVLDSYEDCCGPPRLDLLDRFDPGGPGSCLKRYSDPTFFKRASAASGEAGTPKVSKANQGYKIKKRRSWSRNIDVSQRASFSYQTCSMKFAQLNVGGHASPSQTMSPCDAALRSDLSEHSCLDLRNGFGRIEGDFHGIHSMQPKEQESREFIASPVKRHDRDYLDYNFLKEKVSDARNDIQINLTQEQGVCTSYSANWDEKPATLQDGDHDSVAQEDEHDRNLESFLLKLDLETLSDVAVNIEKPDGQICIEALPTFGFGDIHLDNFESETDHFTDALNSIDPESQTDIDCIRKPEIDEYSKLEDKAAEDGLPEMIKHNSECQNSNPESNIWANSSLITGGCEHNPIPVSPNPPSAACCSISRVATRDESNSLSPVDEALLQSVQMTGELSNPGSLQSIDSSLGGTNDGKNVASVSCAVSSNLRESRSAMLVIGDKTSSLESQKPAPETSNVASVTIWTNGGLLGLQPSKPPDFSVLNALPQDPLSTKDAQISSSTQYLISSDKNRAGPVKIESSQNIAECPDMDSSMCQEKQDSGISPKKTSWKISPADLDIRVGKRSDSFSPNNFSSSKASVTASGNVLPVNPESLAATKLQEVTKSSSRMFELSNKLLKPGSSKKLLHGGDENSGHTSYQNANALKQKNHQNFAHQAFAGRNRDLFGGESQIPSPPSSPPLAHMKISFQPIDGFETSRLKLKFPYGNTNDESSRDVFPSFQLVPEVSITQHNIGSDSEDDTFHGSSPSLSDDCHRHQSESNSEQRESRKSPSTKDPDLYGSLGRISLTESSTVMGNGKTSHGDFHDNFGSQFPFAENSMQGSHSFHSVDLQSMETLNPSLQEELRNDTNSKDLVEPEAATTPDPPPLPPVEWRGMKPQLEVIQDGCKVMPKGTNYACDVTHSASIITQQPKPAPFNQDQSFETTNEQQSKKRSHGLREAKQGKSMDEKKDFLQQIRTKSFNLRPTVAAKSTAPLGESPNIQVTAILKKANAIRQAVGSDDGEDDGNWSDT
ncbi:protein SCAR1 [Sesamum indicum]|uniref:Protein SCAR n=1 Tax=Sesamum indicum TaxID=4182 RepID=A0A6I9ULF3_SESIN|nr:protein SCAR1 [Sesamum indicum]XP_011101382.1 protein SCAR1 [Sesamum indicum]